MTEIEYDKIADALHDALIAAGPPEDMECVHAWNAVRDVSARLSALFDRDPAFEYEAWLTHVMKGAPE